MMKTAASPATEPSNVRTLHNFPVHGAKMLALLPSHGWPGVR